ncbi:MAG: alpha/beta-type small acid-soluble spore protein [Bacillota bacterium]|nr:alpha/beta-type small acid-soluble spore protein [Bacillota bacterium]
MARRPSRRVENPQAEEELDRLKYEVADELGLRDDIRRRGWEKMTTRETGRIGGQMVRRMIRFAEERLGRPR